MATEIGDALLILRDAISSNKPPIPTTSADATTSTPPELSLSQASHLYFPSASQSFPLTTPTRFVSSDSPVELRSIYFAWLTKDDPVPEYIAATQKLNDELAAPGGLGGKVQNLVFIEKIDLITWLEGASDESEHIKPLEIKPGSAAAAPSAAAATAAATSAQSGQPGLTRPVRNIDPRLAAIYAGERRMADLNSILRGIKPTDFSHVRKMAEQFLGTRSRPKPGAPPGPGGQAISSNPALVSLPKKAGRRPDPVILLSPSASSLLRMSNVKKFLGEGKFLPADHPEFAGATDLNLLQITRMIPSIDPSREVRFRLVESPEQFKPEFWSRLVAVFTTGQTWQFKSYKWSNPPELFNHALGLYVGWAGEEPPSNVKAWGRGVRSVQIEKWSSSSQTQQRWRDRQVVENIWAQIEDFMKAKGWSKESGPTVQ